VVARTREEIEALLAGTSLVEPGLVWTPQWRPDGGEPAPESPSDARIHAAVGEVALSRG
jgi:hypothetical protein